MNHHFRRALQGLTASLLLAATSAALADSYRITLTDLTTGQPFSPPVFATHDSSFSLWQAGTAASNGIRQIAEAGNRVPLLNDITPLVGSSIGSLTTPLSSPLPPGDSVTVYISADAAHPYLSSAWMLGRTNDTFAGQTDLNLLSLSGTQTFNLVALDAGTEINTELATDVGALGGSGHPAENGVIHLSSGIRGIDHFDNGLGVDVNGIRTDVPASWRYGSPVARLTITAVPEPSALALLVSCGLGGGLALRRRARKR